MFKSTKQDIKEMNHQLSKIVHVGNLHTVLYSKFDNYIQVYPDNHQYFKIMLRDKEQPLKI